MRPKEHMCLLCLCLELCLETTPPHWALSVIQLPVDQHQLLRLDCSVPSHVGCVISAAMKFVERRLQVRVSGQPHHADSPVQCNVCLGPLWSAPLIQHRLSAQVSAS